MFLRSASAGAAGDLGASFGTRTKFAGEAIHPLQAAVHGAAADRRGP